MKLNPAPSLPSYLQESFTYSTAIQDAIATRIAALEADTPPPSLKGQFDHEKRSFISSMAEKRLATREVQRHYIKAMDATRQVLSKPTITDKEFDIFAALDQPEILNAFAKWTYPRGGAGFEANPTCAKALLSLIALGQAPYVRSARRDFVASSGVQKVFADVENKVAKIAGRDPKICKPTEYTGCLDHIRGLCSTNFDDELMMANVEMFKSFRKMFPDAEIAEYAATDGTDVAAHVAQIGVGKTEDEELEIRRRTPHAGARSKGPGGEFSFYGDDGELITGTKSGKFFRGYFLVVLVCIKTGLPLVWTLRDANPMEGETREASMLRDLLKRLYKFWPDCPLRVITGDKAWDFEEFHRVCLTQYGIHLAIIQRDDNKAKVRAVDQVDHKNIVKYNGLGEAYCRHKDEKTEVEHGRMSLVGYEFANRDNLTPGATADLSKFRVRFRCEHCEKTYSLPTSGIGKNRDWHFFTYYPHSPTHPKRYAMRRAMENRRNIAESTFASLKIACQLALRGPARTRLADFDTVATLLGMSFTLRNAQALAAERIRQGHYADSFPANLLGGRQMMTA